MGWLFEYHTDDMTRKEYAAKLLKSIKATWSRGSIAPVKHALCGNHLWVLLETYRKDTGQITQFIMLYLLSKRGTWGYKDMDEDCWPYYFTCPVHMLNATKPWTKNSINWRKDCAEDRAQKNARRRKRLTTKSNRV